VKGTSVSLLHSAQTSAVLVKLKGNFSWGWYIFWSIASFPSGIIFYPIYRLIKSDRVADPYVEDGKVKRG
jgi:hypothetical protein